MADLTKGKEGKVIFSFAVPMLLGMIFQQLYNFVDSIIVGHFIGKEALAAVGASFPFIFLLISLIIGIASGATIIIAQYFGNKDTDKVKRTIDTLHIFLFIGAVIVSVLSVFFSRDVLLLLNIPADVLPDAQKYLNIYLCGFIVFFGFNGTSAILRGLGDSKTPLYFLVASTLINIVLDLLFIIIFKMGVEGAAYATILAQGGVYVVMVLYLNKTHDIIKFSFLNMKFDKKIFMESLRIGLPSGLQTTFVALGMMALMGIVSGFGTDVLAAYSAAGRIDMMAVLPAMAFSTALSTFVGQNLGANKIERVKKGFYATLKLTIIGALIVTIFTSFFGSELMAMFVKDQNVINIGAKYLLIVCSFYIVFSTMFVISGVMRGAGDTLIPMFITLFALWVIRIPFAYLLSDKIGVIGIWWSIPIAWFIGMIFSFLYYKTGRWKTKSVVKHSL